MDDKPLGLGDKIAALEQGMECLNDKIDKILEYATPPEEEILEGKVYDEEVKSADTAPHSNFDEENNQAVKKLLDSVERYVKATDRLEAAIENMEAGKRPNFTGEPEPDVRFARGRMIFLSAGISFSGIVSILMYKLSFLAAFPFAFSLLFTFSMLYLVWLIDKYYFEGNTLGKIASTPLSAAFGFIGIVTIVVAGYYFGNSLITKPIGADETGERNNTQIEARQPQPAATIYEDSSKAPVNSGKVSGDNRDSER